MSTTNAVSPNPKPSLLLAQTGPEFDDASPPTPPTKIHGYVLQSDKPGHHYVASLMRGLSSSNRLGQAYTDNSDPNTPISERAGIIPFLDAATPGDAVVTTDQSVTFLLKDMFSWMQLLFERRLTAIIIQGKPSPLNQPLVFNPNEFSPDEITQAVKFFEAFPERLKAERKLSPNREAERRKRLSEASQRRRDRGLPVGSHLAGIARKWRRGGNSTKPIPEDVQTIQEIYRMRDEGLTLTDIWRELQRTKVRRTVSSRLRRDNRILITNKRVEWSRRAIEDVLKARKSKQQELA